MISKKFEINKQVIGDDPDLQKSGRILNRVIKWKHNGITIEADQRHVREILKGLNWSKRIALQHHAVWRGWMNARERVGADRNRSRLNTSGTLRTTVMTGTDREW